MDHHLPIICQLIHSGHGNHRVVTTVRYILNYCVIVSAIVNEKLEIN